MRLITAKNMGFCFGVRRAVDMALEAAARCGRVYTYGELIHNREVVSELACRGVIPVASLADCNAGDTVIIRSHGVPPEAIEECRVRGLNVIDCTCPFVMKIHGIVTDAYANGCTVFVCGDKKHPECIGVNGCCQYNAVFCGGFTAQQAGECFKTEVAPHYAPEAKVCLVSQTTYDREAYEALCAEFKRYFSAPMVFDTVCSTTRQRQKEAAELSQKCDIMLVLGDRHSSNTQKLASICAENCKNLKRIANISEIPLDIINNDDIIVGVVAGASAPDSLIREVITRMSEQEKAAVDCCTAENTENVAAVTEAVADVASIRAADVTVAEPIDLSATVEEYDATDPASLNPLTRSACEMTDVNIR